MKSKIVFLLFAVILLPGCIVWDAGYTENEPIVRYDVPEIEKVPISYSVTLFNTRPDVCASPDNKSVQTCIEDSLMATGLFSDVSYSEKIGKDSYHIAFKFRQAGTDLNQSCGLYVLTAVYLATIPSYDVITFDGSAILSIKGNVVFSSANAEEVRYFT